MSDSANDPGVVADGFALRCFVPLARWWRLPSPGYRLPPFRAYRLSAPAKIDHRERSPTAYDLVFSAPQSLRQNRSQASAPAGRVARENSAMVALPDGLPVGRQRQSLHFSRPRAKKGRWADARVSKRFASPKANSSASYRCRSFCRGRTRPTINRREALRPGRASCGPKKARNPRLKSGASEVGSFQSRSFHGDC